MELTRKIPAEVCDLLYGCRPGDTEDDWTLVADGEHGHSRWESLHVMVLKDLFGNFWGVDYSLGLTEGQDSTIPWRKDIWSNEPVTEVEAYAMERVTETIVRYVKKKVS